MSRFYVGQRVRYARVYSGAPKMPPSSGLTLAVGAQVTIKKIVRSRKGTITTAGIPLTRDTDCSIQTDDGRLFSVEFWQLEPIVDPGREVMSWSDERCVWKPEHLRSRV